MGGLAETIEVTAERFNSIAPSWMKYDAEKGFALQILKNNQYLRLSAEKHPGSLQQAITNVAAIGLSLNPAEKLAYLIPRNIKYKDANNRDRYENRIFLEPSYMGLIRLATDSGSIEWVQANCVYDNDEFEDNGPGNKPTHKYKAFKDRGEFVGVYCVAKTVKGDYLTTVMGKNKVEDIRSRSESYKKGYGPWKSDPEEMSKKTVVRSAFKTWPRTDERRMAILSEAVHMSNENQGFEPILTSPEINQFTEEQKEYYDQCIEKSKSIEMFVFSKTVDEGIFTNLYHSFEKGQKGKYQRVVDSLLKNGADVFNNYLSSLKAAINNEDESGIKELLNEINGDTMNMLQDNLSVEENMYFQRVIRE